MANRNSVHHLVPRSRLPKKSIQRLNPINTSLKLNKTHRAWHDVFSNLTPFETLVFYLTEIRADFFTEAEIISSWEGVISESFVLGNDNFEMDFFACKKEKFCNLEDLLRDDNGTFNFFEIIIRNWSPSDYFYYVSILDYKGERFEYCSSEVMLSLNMV